MDGLIGYVLAKGYVDKALAGTGAIRGASCQIHSITPVAGGNNVVFSWVDDSGSIQLSAPMFVADGKSSYDLWLAAGNTGTEAQFLASLKGADGATGPQGPQGDVGPQGADGQDGVGIDRIEKVGTVDLVTTYKIIFTDGTSFEYEVKDGKEGSGDSSITLTQVEYEALTEEERLNGLYYTYDTKRIYKNGIQYGASDPIPLTMEEYKALKEAGAIDEQQEYLIEANTDGILLVAEDIGYDNTKSGIQATTVQGAIDALAKDGAGKYITEDQLLAKDYADKAYVAEEITKVSTGGSIDLTPYLKKTEASATYVEKETGKSLVDDTEIARLADMMLKSVYDTDDDGIVDKADSAITATNATDAANAENLKLSDGTTINADTINTKVNSIEQNVTNLENKYKQFFDNINVSGSSLIIGSSTVATITGTTLHINQNTV